MEDFTVLNQEFQGFSDNLEELERGSKSKEFLKNRKLNGVDGIRV